MELFSKNWPVQIPLKAGYVSLVEGNAGIGKTSFSLACCIESKKDCTYISYAEPETSILSKASLISPSSKIKIVRMMTGDPSRAFSTILNALENSELVVLDSLDAMFYGIRDEKDVRSFLQLIYNSVKGKSGSLLIISEGTSSASAQIRFVSDAIIQMSDEKIMDGKARCITVLKDRDSPVPPDPFYFTLSNGFMINEPLPQYFSSSIKNVNAIARPQEAGIDMQLTKWNRILTVFGEGVGHVVGSLFREWVAADYLLAGKRINYIISKIEYGDEIASNIYELVGSKTENLKVITADANSVDFDPLRYSAAMTSGHAGDNVVNMVDVLADEEFAVVNPQGYEKFVSHITPRSSSSKNLTLLYGSGDLNAAKVQQKYADVERRLIYKSGHLFWKTMKPPGPLYHVDVNAEKRTMTFTRMM
ncbi:MAG: hypothetical protein JRN26_06915 [Nitrososphaerota archaeon]|nr:hypothetical protein [Nitrososphaerota archaeon]MDG6927421.1 hypothetical protein [Nitrososphaerota archaeon]MDG6931225.1 hypothetical protein [Nitrososphaerota archaeon]MDG6931888.1 hypothetical protein [Nitrososphaerota archaeon]MDG6936592.1 hypothetical protein [Nitrososphaerota archaeon]